LVPVEAEPMAAVIAHSQVAANPLRPRAVNRRTLAINTVARRAADWVDAARFVLLGFLYEGRGRTSWWRCDEPRDHRLDSRSKTSSHWAAWRVRTSSSAVSRARQMPNIAVGLV
jgi:hypothetical protein